MSQKSADPTFAPITLKVRFPPFPDLPSRLLAGHDGRWIDVTDPSPIDRIELQANSTAKNTKKAGSDPTFLSGEPVSSQSCQYIRGQLF